MSDVRSALIATLGTLEGPAQAQAEAREALRAAVGEVDLNAARQAALDKPESAEHWAIVLGKMLLEDADANALVDTAKAAAQRAPREDEGNDVALLAGEVVWRVGGQPKLAEPYFRRVRRSEAANSSVLDFYRSLFAAESAASQLMQVLVQARRAEGDAERRFVLAEEMSDVAQNRLRSADRAVEVWRAVLREEPNDPRPAAHLERLYRESGKWTALVELLKERFDQIPATDETRQVRITKLAEIADLYRRELKLDTMALATLQRILEIDPAHRESLEALADTYAQSKRYNDLLRVYGQLLEAAQANADGEQQIDALRKIAGIWVERLGNPQRALEPLAQVLALAPGDREARGMMAKIHEQRRDWRSLIALRREELAERSGAEALALRVDLARLAEEKLGDRSEAIQDWNAVLEHHGEVDAALEALARLYQREGRWAEAAEIIHRQVSRADSVGRAVKLLTEVGQIYTERLHSTTDAIRVWKEIARLVPGHEKAMRMLREAYVEQAMWDELTELYVGQNRVSQLVDVLQSAADRVSDVEERVALYRRVARLCREQLGQPERAVKALERTLAIKPDNLEVARELLPIYREQSNWARLLGTLEVLYVASADVDEKLELIGQMREIASENLQSPTITLQCSARAYELRPTDEALRTDLEKAAEGADGWDELTRIFEARIESSPEDERLILLRKLAVIARDRLFKPDDAQRYFRRIIELDPSNAEAMGALESIYSHTRRWDDLSEVYRRRLDVTEDRQARLDTLRGLARLQEEHLGNLDAAVDTYRAILEIEPEDAGTLEALARILRSRGAWEPLAQVLERKLALGSGKRIDTLFELSQIRASRLHDSDRAVDGFLTILSEDPVHADTVRALEELRQADPSTGLRVMQGLLPYYKRVENRVKEAEAMEVLLAAEEDPTRRMEKLAQLAGIYEKMPDRKVDAQRIQMELFSANPGSWETRQVLHRLGRELGNMDEVAHAYERVLAGISQKATAAESEGRAIDRTEATQRRDLLLELAAILRDDLGRPADAERAYVEVLERDETHQGAYEALEVLVRKREAWPELVALYRRRADVVFNQREQRDLLSRIIEIARAVLGDRETAQATAEELLDLIPDDLATVQLLAGMYRQGDTPTEREKLEELLGRWAELVDDRQERYTLLCHRAELRMQYLGDAYGAVDLLGAVLGEEPDHGTARELLEQLLDIAEVQLQVAALLEPIYQRVGDHDGRIRILRVRRSHAEAAGSIDEATSYLLEIARIEEHERGNPRAAFEAAREAYLTDPRRLDTLQEVERLGTGLGRERELVIVWQTALGDPKVNDKTLRIDLTQRTARLLDERLRDSVGARAAYVQLLALDPPDFDLAHRTVAALCRLHLEAGDFIALVETQQALLRFVDSHVDRVQIRLNIASNQLVHLRDRVGAALTWSEVVDMEPANQIALDALENLFLEEEEWNRLCEVLEHRIGVSTEARSQAHLWKRIGHYRREKLGELQAALNAFQSVLDLKVGREESVHALQQLVEINRDLERWPDVEEGLRRLTALADKDGDRVRLLAETAEIVGKRLGRGTDALELLKRVLDLSPTDGRARVLVGTYLEDDATRERAIRILTPLFEAEQNWASLLELQELQARKQPSGRRRLQALLKVAATHEEKLGDPERAFSVLCEAMTEAGDQPELAEILDKVERLGNVPERAESLFAALERTVDHILDSDLQQRVLRWVGQVSLERLGRLDSARRAYETVLELAPQDEPATAALEQIYLRQGEHEALADLLLHKAERLPQGSGRDDLLIRAAEIHRTRLSRAERATELYERLSAEGLEREAVQAILEPLYEAAGRHRELAAHLNRKLARLTGAERVDTHLRLGRLYGGELSDPEEGIRHLATALRLDPNHAVGTDELSRYLDDPAMRSRAAAMLEPVFTTVQDWPRLLQIQEVKLQEAEDEEIRVRIMLRMAQLQEEQLEDLDAAFEGYGRVFREQPGNRYVRDQLARLANVLGKSETYADILTRHVADRAETSEVEEILAISAEAADVWARVLKRWAKAVPLYQRILAARPEDRDTFAKLEQALVEAGMWTDLAEAYWHEADQSLDEDRQVEVLMRLASVAQDALGRPEEAARAFQRILELRPEHEVARARLEQVFERSQRWDDLIELLRDRLSRTEDVHVRGGVLMHVAELQNGPLDDPDGAIDSLETVLAEDPGDAHAVTMLERMAEGRVEQRPRIFAVLQPVYEAANNTQRLVAVVEWKLTVTEEPPARQNLYRDLARLLEMLPDGTQYAFRALMRAVAEPGPSDVLTDLDSQLDRYATALHMPEALAEALFGAAQAPALADHPERRLQLLVRAARLHIKSAPDVAVEVLRHALAINENHETALELMDEALVRLGYHEDLCKILERRVAVATDDTAQVELLRRLASLLEDVLAHQAAGEKAWRRLLEIAPSDPEALRRLSRSYEQSGSTTKLVDVLERRIDASEDASERRSLRMQLASIHREAAKDRAAEIDVLRALLSEAPSDDDALAALARALLAESRHAEAADVIQDRATLAESVERKAALMLDAARIYAGPLEDLTGSVERYEQVLNLVDSHDGALSDLVALSGRPEVSESVTALVRPRLEAIGRFDALAAVLTNRARLAESVDEQTTALRELAAIRRDRLQDIPGALDATLQLIDKSEGELMKQVLASAMRLASEIDRLADHIVDMAARSNDTARAPEVRIALAMSAAEAAADLQGDRDRALEILVPLLDAEFATLRVCERIEELARASGQTEIVARALVEATKQTIGQDTHPGLLVRLGDARFALGQLDGATEAYRDALEAKPNETAALQGLEQVLEARLAARTAPSAILLDALEAAYQAAGNKAGVAGVTRIRLDQAAGADRTGLLQSLAAQLEEGGGTSTEALDAHGRLLAEDPESSHALDRVLALAKESDEHMRKAGELLLAAVASADRAGAVPAPLALQACRLWLRRLGDPNRASEALRPLLARQADHPEGLMLAVETARAVGDASALHDALERAAAAVLAPQEAAALWREAAHVADAALGDPTVAMRDLRQLLDVDESDLAAWQKLLVLLGAAQRHEELAEALTKRTMITADDDERRELRYRLANLLVDKLDRVDDAVVIYNEMLAASPNDLGAMRDLEVLLRREERWSDVRDLLERKLEALGTDNERVEVLEHLARLAEEKLDEPNEAIEAHQRVLALRPDHDKAAIALQRLLGREQRWEDLARLLETRMETLRLASDMDGYRKTASRLAELLAGRLGDSDRAQEILTGLLEIDPSYVPAILSLAAVYEARGDEGAMRLTLQRAADLDPKGSAGAMLQIRLAKLTDDREKRREHLEAALVLDPANQEAGDALLEQSRADANWDRVVHLLQMAIGRAESEDDRRRLQFERIDVMVEKMHDLDGALRVLAGIYERVQDDAEINSRIANALFQAGRLEEAQGMYQWLVSVGSEGAGRKNKGQSVYLTRLARIELAQGATEAAQKRLEEAYRVDTTNVETQMTLGALHEQNEKWAEALKIYRSMLLQNADKSGLLRRGDIYLRIGATHMGLGEKPKAQAMLRRGLEEDPGHPHLAEALAAIG